MIKHRIMKCSKCGHTCECPNCTFEEKIVRNEEIVAMYRQGGITMKKIAKEFGISQVRVRQILVEMIPPKKLRSLAHKVTQMSASKEYRDKLGSNPPWFFRNQEKK